MKKIKVLSENVFDLSKYTVDEVVDIIHDLITDDMKCYSDKEYKRGLIEGSDFVVIHKRHTGMVDFDAFLRKDFDRLYEVVDLPKRNIEIPIDYQELEISELKLNIRKLNEAIKLIVEANS